MIEAEWIACGDPEKMLEFLRAKASDRKLRLFAVESVRLASKWLIHPNSLAAVEASERVAEGVSSTDILAPFYRAAWDVLPLEPYSDVHVVAARAAARTVQEQAYEAATLTKNEIVELHAVMEEEKVVSEVEKYRVYWIGKAQGETLLVAFLHDIFGNPLYPPSPLPRGVIAWNDATVRRIAEGIYKERAFGRLGILVDALLDAGCEDEELIGHCRSEGPHVRGCWGVDLILGRS